MTADRPKHFGRRKNRMNTPAAEMFRIRLAHSRAAEQVVGQLSIVVPGRNPGRRRAAYKASGQGRSPSRSAAIAATAGSNMAHIDTGRIVRGAQAAQPALHPRPEA